MISGAIGRRTRLELAAQRSRVVVLEALELHAGEPAGVDQAAVRERIENHSILRREQRRNHGQVRQITRS